MITVKKQYFGIKFPFTANNNDGFFLDLNTDLEEKTASEIAHVLLTPKRTRIYKPDFGTNIIKYIFENNDEFTWEEVEREAKENIGKYVPNAELNDIAVVRPAEEPHSIYLDMTFSVRKGLKTENKRMVISLVK